MATPSHTRHNAGSLTQYWWVLLVIAAIVATVFGILSLRTKTTVTKKIDPSELAQNNRMLALSRLLKPHGFTVDYQERKKLDTNLLPSINDVLLLTSGAEMQSERDQARLIDWLQKGGRLIIVADFRHAEKDESTDDLDSEPAEPVEPADENNFLWYWDISTSALKYPDDFNRPNKDTTDDEQRTLNLTVESNSRNSNTPVQTETIGWSLPYYALPDVGIHYTPNDDTLLSARTAAPAHSVFDEDTDAMVQFYEGKGQVLVLSTDRWLNNDSLKNADNAFLALRLFESLRAHQTPAASSESVIHVYSANPYNDTPNLLNWLWHHAPHAIGAAALCLFLWLWRYRFITGPRLSPQVDARRDLLEHLNATGWFVYRGDKGASWLAALAKQFNQSIASKHFIESTRAFQANVSARLNQFSRLNPFARAAERKKNDTPKEPS
ncbi:MAG: DUF4350 domain-containing protein [Formosimonas sp.]